MTGFNRVLGVGYKERNAGTDEDVHRTELLSRLQCCRRDLSSSRSHCAEQIVVWKEQVVGTHTNCGNRLEGKGGADDVAWSRRIDSSCSSEGGSRCGW